MMEKWLRIEFGEDIEFLPAKGGFHLYCLFPKKTKAEVDNILQELLKKNIIFLEVQKFGDQKNGFRLSFAHFQGNFLSEVSSKGNID
jgi:DNA-binding transcriptional MocR family regulator